MPNFSVLLFSITLLFAFSSAGTQMFKSLIYSFSLRSVFSSIISFRPKEIQGEFPTVTILSKESLQYSIMALDIGLVLFFQKPMAVST